MAIGLGELLVLASVASSSTYLLSPIWLRRHAQSPLVSSLPSAEWTNGSPAEPRARHRRLAWKAALATAGVSLLPSGISGGAPGCRVSRERSGACAFRRGCRPPVADPSEPIGGVVRAVLTACDERHRDEIADRDRRSRDGAIRGPDRDPPGHAGAVRAKPGRDGSGGVGGHRQRVGHRQDHRGARRARGRGLPERHRHPRMRAQRPTAWTRRRWPSCWRRARWTVSGCPTRSDAAPAGAPVAVGLGPDAGQERDPRGVDPAG